MEAAQGMAEAVFPDCAAPLDAPLLALEQSTIAARRSEVQRWHALHCLMCCCHVCLLARPCGWRLLAEQRLASC